MIRYIEEFGEVRIIIEAETVGEIIEILNAREDDDWITWDGGECPVMDHVRVDVKFRNGCSENERLADNWTWSHTGSSLDIVAYKVAK